MKNIFASLFGKPDSGNLSEVLSQGAYLVDVRSPGEFSSGSVPGAVNIPLDTIQNKVSTLKNKKNIVVFCRSGARSSQAKNILESAGITGVTNGFTVDNVNSARQK